jgi:large subunit ribosomal protein L2
MIRLPTGKLLILSSFCVVTLGKCSNYKHKKNFLTKAGFTRMKGIRPTVRGVAMNPVDHPHGGRTKVVQPEVTP